MQIGIIPIYRIICCLLFVTLVASNSAVVANTKYSNDAIFRSWARDMYRDFHSASCVSQDDSGPQPSLQSELQALAQLEQKLKKTPAGQHLRIAREDEQYLRLYVRKLSADCLLDHKSRSIVGERAERTLLRVRQLSRGVRPIDRNALQVTGNPAAFRFHAEHIVEMLNPICPLAKEATNSFLVAKAKEAANHFRREIESRPYAKHFTIAEEDLHYARAIGPTAECAVPYFNEPPNQISAQILTGVENEIAKAREAMKPAA